MSKTELKLVTFNARYRPLFIDTIIWPLFVRDLPGARKRVKRLSKVLRQQHYNIVCLQEVFDHKVAATLGRRLKRKGEELRYERVIRGFEEASSKLFNSGLVFADKLGSRVRSVKFVEFEDAKGNDAKAQKGVARALIHVGYDQQVEHIIYLFNTHLQAGGDHASLRKKQLCQIRALLDQTVSRPSSDSTRRVSMLLCGDLNVSDKKPEYHKMLDILGNPRDLFREKYPTLSGATTRGSQKRIDYWLAWDSLNGVDLAPVEVKGVSNSFATSEAQRSQLSDHLPVTLKIRV